MVQSRLKIINGTVVRTSHEDIIARRSLGLINVQRVAHCQASFIIFTYPRTAPGLTASPAAWLVSLSARSLTNQFRGCGSSPHQSSSCPPPFDRLPRYRRNRPDLATVPCLPSFPGACLLPALASVLDCYSQPSAAFATVLSSSSIRERRPRLSLQSLVSARNVLTGITSHSYGPASPFNCATLFETRCAMRSSRPTPAGLPATEPL